MVNEIPNGNGPTLGGNCTRVLLLKKQSDGTYELLEKNNSTVTARYARFSHESFYVVGFVSLNFSSADEFNNFLEKADGVNLGGKKKELNLVKSSSADDPVINGLSSLSLRAGVGDVLIISGENFGNMRGKVFFRNADEPEEDDGTPIYLNGLDDIYYVPQPGNPDGWKDDQIAVKIPSAVYDGGSEGNGAGSGFIIVQLPDVGGLPGPSVRSDDVLIIEYSLNIL